MNGSYKVKFSEGQKSVTTEVVVENEDKDKTLEEAKELFELASAYSKVKTREKYFEQK